MPVLGHRGEPLLCRLVGHKWHIWRANIAASESYRERRCGRCLKAGRLTIDRQPRRYFGGAAGPWKPLCRETADYNNRRSHGEA